MFLEAKAKRENWLKGSLGWICWELTETLSGSQQETHPKHTPNTPQTQLHINIKVRVQFHLRKNREILQDPI